MKCPKCNETLSGQEIVRLNAQLQGSKKSPAKSMASKLNGKLGGRPKKIPEVREMCEQSS